MKANESLSRRLDFDARPEQYDSGRPAADIRALEHIVIDNEFGSVLEIGAGTGQATLQICGIVERVVAIEPGKQLAGILTRRCQQAQMNNVEVRADDFESCDLERHSFDAICSFNAYQWIRQPHGNQRVRELLAPGGRLVLTWSFPILAERSHQLAANRIHADATADFQRDWDDFELNVTQAVSAGQAEMVADGFRLESAYFMRRTLERLPGRYERFLASLANGSSLSVFERDQLRAAIPHNSLMLELTASSVYSLGGQSSAN